MALSLVLLELTFIALYPYHVEGLCNNNTHYITDDSIELDFNSISTKMIPNSNYNDLLIKFIYPNIDLKGKLTYNNNEIVNGDFLRITEHYNYHRVIESISQIVLLEMVTPSFEDVVTCQIELNTCYYTC